VILLTIHDRKLATDQFLRNAQPEDYLGGIVGQPQHQGGAPIKEQRPSGVAVLITMVQWLGEVRWVRSA
jgi:hypothetical protein